MYTWGLLARVCCVGHTSPATAAAPAPPGLSPRRIAWFVALFWFWWAPLFAQPAEIRAAQSRHSALLSCGGSSDPEQLWACAGEFTARVAYDVRGSEWTIFRKLGGRRCDHAGTTIDCDKLLNTRTREFFDVVGGAGAPGMRVAWISEGFDHPNNLVPVQAQPYQPAPPPVPNPGTPVPEPGTPPDLSTLRAAIDNLSAEIVNLRAEIARQSQQHDGIAAVATEARDVAYQARDHAYALRHEDVPAILGKFTVAPCYAGSQSGWAGGKIRLCPE